MGFVSKGESQGSIDVRYHIRAFSGDNACDRLCAGYEFAEYIEKFDHWIALILLGFIGLNMICGSGDDEIQTGGRLTFGAVLVQGFATSVDALAVGISFAALGVGIVRSAAFICVVTAALSFCGFMLGNKFSGKLKSKARIVGGVILICIGLKIFAEQTIFA